MKVQFKFSFIDRQVEYMNVETLLSQRVHMPQINSVVSWASDSRENIVMLWTLARSNNRRTCVNALWVMTHLPETDAEWLLSIRDEIIDMLLTESDSGKKRLLLQLLKEQEYNANDVRTDLLDFCLSKINSECEPYAVRCFSIYVAYRMCRHFSELVAELEEHLDMMQYQSLSPGLKSALRQTKAKIEKQKNLWKKCKH